MALIWAMRGLVQGVGEVAPDAWQRFLDIQLAGMRAAGPLSSAAPMSARQLSKLAPSRRHHESADPSSVRHGGSGRVPGGGSCAGS
jgi:hypothetical protein